MEPAFKRILPRFDPTTLTIMRCGSAVGSQQRQHHAAGPSRNEGAYPSLCALPPKRL